MSTQSWSTRVRHDSDATFREWGSEFNTKLAAAGLVQTSDTGQINWTTVTRPGTNTDAGYEVWKLNDSLFSTAPIYIRFDYGTSGSATQPSIKATVGTGTNGAGTLTGTALTTARRINGNNSAGVDTTYQSYVCVAEGFVGIAWKTTNQLTGTLFVCRTVDSTGAYTATGAMVYWGNGLNSGVTATQALRFAATAAAYTAQTAIPNTALCINPQTPTATTVGSNIQAMVAWTITPAVAPLLGVCGVGNTELSLGSTFSVALVGSTAHTYIALDEKQGAIGVVAANATGGLKPAMLWE